MTGNPHRLFLQPRPTEHSDSKVSTREQLTLEGYVNLWTFGLKVRVQLSPVLSGVAMLAKGGCCALLTTGNPKLGFYLSGWGTFPSSTSRCSMGVWGVVEELTELDVWQRWVGAPGAGLSMQERELGVGVSQPASVTGGAADSYRLL